MMSLLLVSMVILQVETFTHIVNSTNGTTINHVGFQLHNNKTLNVSQVAKYTATTNSSCVQKCFDVKTCFSMNYFPASNFENCILLADNMHEKMSKFVDFPSSVHISLKNTGCDSKSCLNNGLCVPNYNDATSTCACAKEFTGNYCEQNIIKVDIPFSYFPFNGSTTNYGRDPGQMSIKLVKGAGRLVYVPDRVGQVLFCHGRCTESIVNDPVWSDPSIRPEWDLGLTISFWIKLRPGEYNREAPTRYTKILSTEGRGFVIFYDKQEEKWQFVVRDGSRRFQGTIEMKRKKSLRWQHLAMTYLPSKNTFDCYVDGERRSGGYNFVNDVKQEQLQLFHPESPNSFYIDDFMVWRDWLLLEKDVLSEWKNQWA